MINACEFHALIELNKEAERINRKLEEEARIKKEEEERRNKVLLTHRFCEEVLVPLFEKKTVNSLESCVSLKDIKLHVEKDGVTFSIRSFSEEEEKSVSRKGNWTYHKKVNDSKEKYDLNIVKDFFRNYGFKVEVWADSMVTYSYDYRGCRKALAYTGYRYITIDIDCDLMKKA